MASGANSSQNEGEDLSQEQMYSLTGFLIYTCVTRGGTSCQSPQCSVSINWLMHGDPGGTVPQAGIADRFSLLAIQAFTEGVCIKNGPVTSHLA